MGIFRVLGIRSKFDMKGGEGFINCIVFYRILFEGLLGVCVFKVEVV